VTAIGGWFRVERDIIDKAVFEDKSLLQIYIYLRSQAKYMSTEKLIDNKKVTLQPGQLTLGSRQLGSALGVSPATAYRLLKKLEKLNEITIHPYKSCSLITMNYWPTETSKSETPSKPVIPTDSGDISPEDETQMKRKRNADETQMKTPIESKKDKKKDIVVPYEEIVELYHAICKSLPKIRTLTDNRKKTIKARWNGSTDLFKEVFTVAEQSDFLTGRKTSQNNPNWKADFDWLINEQNMAKVLEGKYSNKEQPAQSHKKVFR